MHWKWKKFPRKWKKEQGLRKSVKNKHDIEMLSLHLLEIHTGTRMPAHLCLEVTLGTCCTGVPVMGQFWGEGRCACSVWASATGRHPTPVCKAEGSCGPHGAPQTQTWSPQSCQGECQSCRPPGAVISYRGPRGRTQALSEAAASDK